MKAFREFGLSADFMRLCTKFNPAQFSQYTFNSTLNISRNKLINILGMRIEL